jgi:hypothetical protein
MYAHCCGINIEVNISYSSVVAFPFLPVPLSTWRRIVSPYTAAITEVVCVEQSIQKCASIIEEKSDKR